MQPNETYAALARLNRAGVDYTIAFIYGHTRFAVMAPHGGGIEPGTSELACAIAGKQHSYYTFSGIKTSGNRLLHRSGARQWP